ncbi:MAG: VWA domain-containing protein [Actinomycetia bacterium]|nr:VWA domain-containing protein [Actinomycetes bacterium]
MRATTFGSLRRLATDNYFTAQSSKRAAIVLTDGESRSFEIEALAAELREEVISLFVVRFWSVDERVWEPDGTPEPYRPDPSAGVLLARLGTDLGEPIVDEHEHASLVASVRRRLGEGRSWSLEQTRRPSRSPPESRCSLRCRSRSCSSAGPAEWQRFRLRAAVCVE